MLKSAHFWIEKLDLLKHPEGGWYREIYRSEDMVSQAGLPAGFGGDRNFCTSIYYLLEDDDYSAFHRIKSDEIWHFYIGTSAVEIIVIENGLIKKMHLGNIPEKRQTLQVIVTKNTWFAAKLLDPEGFALARCTVSPGFHFDDFEIAGENLLYEFSENKDEILPLLKRIPT